MSRDILLTDIDPDPEQPRKHFDQASLDELAQSMAANGLAVPILVRPGGERYIIVHGERRWRAAQQLGWQSVPAEVRELSAEEAHWLSLIENIQRADLSPIEEARVYRAYLDTGVTQEALGQRIGKTQSYIAQKLRLLTLPKPLMLYLDRRALTENHARQVLRLKKMYGESLTRTFDPDGVHAIGRDESISVADQVFFLLLHIRTQEHPIVSIVPKTEPGTKLLFDGCLAFRDYIEANNYTVPQWSVAAFWWASFALHHDLGVAELHQGITKWHQLFLSALAWWGNKHRTPPEGERSRIQRFWAVWEDLDRMGVLEQAQRGEIPNTLMLEAYNFTLNNDAYILPSAFQSYGPLYESQDQITLVED